jgi:spore coat protein A
MLTRRELIKLGAVAGAAVAIPTGRLGRASDSAVHHHGTSRPAAATADVPLFEVPLTVPPVLRPHRFFGLDIYDVTMREATAEILPGKQTPIWGYDGVFPGPTIRARSGRPVLVWQRNRLPEGTAVHLHGGNVPASSDGHPLDSIDPGGARAYFYPNRQPAATLWYHDHFHHHESAHTYAGLTGMYIIEDDAKRRLRLPHGRHDVPLVIQDRSFNADGSFRPPGPEEFAGDVLLVNGRPHPRFEVAQRAYRFRILNGSSLDGLLELSLDSGGVFHVIGNDGGLLEAPVPVTTLPVAPSERVDVVIDFSRYEVGTQIVMRNTFAGAPKVMRFDVRRRAHRYEPLPSRLVPIARIDPAKSVKQREFVLALDPKSGQMLINGRAFDPERIDIKPKLGTTEIWTIVNGERELPIPHVFHTHLVRFQILDRDGRPSAPLEAGWKDSVRVDPGTSVRIIMTFGDFPGRYLYHCHLLGHADAGMMAQMEVVK